MNTTKPTIKHLLVEIIMKSQMMNEPQKLDNLIQETESKISQAFHENDTLYCEKEISQKYPFLTLIKLRNMRARGNGPKHHKFGQSRNSRVYYRLGDIETWIAENEQTEPYIDPRFREIMQNA